MEVTGFKKIPGGIKDYIIVKTQYAKAEWKDIIAKCRKQAPYKEDILR